MKRIEGKVKDIVDVRPFVTVGAASSPADILSGYRFTDITADLMGKWLDAVLSVKPGAGASIALAGFRGVGKSHFLSVLGAIASESELRTTIADRHVQTVASQMSRRRYPVAVVRRGSRSTLIEEIQDAITELNGGVGDPGTNVDDLLLKASKAGTIDTPLILIIDTAAGRESRVARDDGVILGQIGEAARELGIFVALALDDDIAGADGANRAISTAYSIDYLDQEHLYKIVDTHIFAKKEQALPLLHEIYRYYHDNLPGFRWSEQRFAALYPMHPGILEIAPLIRLHIQDFAMLGFAAEAGVRILGRPADSLIGLDEVFDIAESRLRKVAELNEAFAAFDQLEREVIGKTPVKLRLQAKLILKALFMLSLDGQGATAEELAASMLIFNSGDGEGVDIPALLDSFSSTIPEKIGRTGGSSPRSWFVIGAEDDLRSTIADEAMEVDDFVVSDILLRHAIERFPDINLTDSGDAPASHLQIEWRGSIRRGEIVWDLTGGSQQITPSSFDWSVSARFGGVDSRESSTDGLIAWVLSPLTSEERNVIAKLHVLQTDNAVRERFAAQLAAETQIQALAIDRIWKRVFVTDAVLKVDGTEHRFGDDASAAQTLAQLFTGVLASIFEDRYPNHPEFESTLTVRESGQLIAKFLGSASPSTEMQEYAAAFAVPLGLAVEQDGMLVPATVDSIKELPAVRAGFAGVDLNSPEKVITLAEISARMGAVPYGLTAESQHLILAALVAGRELEFVTSSGNRINHRSLDLQILWDDIAGVAKPAAEVYSSKRLLEWARLVTGNAQLRSLDTSEDRLVVIDTLSGWLSNWREAKFLETFETLPDDDLNSSIWRIAQSTHKTFGKVAESVDMLMQNTISLDKCLYQTAEIFSDSEAEFERQKKDLLVLRYYTESARKRRDIHEYLALSEPTKDPEIERSRAELLALLRSRTLTQDPKTIADIDNRWVTFHILYTDHYVAKHHEALGSLQTNLTNVLDSDRWTAFESFADLPGFDKQFALAANEVIRRSRGQNCEADVHGVLQTRPFCTCSYSLERYDPRRNNARRLEVAMEQGLAKFATNLNDRQKELKSATAPSKLFDIPFDPERLEGLTSEEIAVIRSAILTAEDPTKGRRPSKEELRRTLPDKIEDWEIDDLQVFAGQS